MNFLLSLLFLVYMKLSYGSSVHPLTDMPLSSDDTEITSYFPSNTDLKFPIGSIITSLCHFSNEGLSNYNVTGIMGSLNSPFEFKHHFQNYSYKQINYVIKSGIDSICKKLHDIYICI